MFEISCIEIPNFYLEMEMANTERENIQKFLENREDINKQIILKLTKSTAKSQNQENSSCTADVFLGKFEKERLVNKIFYKLLCYFYLFFSFLVYDFGTY
jgi:hypothetical protein